jgi:hypothetical protein
MDSLPSVVVRAFGNLEALQGSRLFFHQPDFVLRVGLPWLLVARLPQVQLLGDKRFALLFCLPHADDKMALVLAPSLGFDPKPFLRELAHLLLSCMPGFTSDSMAAKHQSKHLPKT